MPHPAVEQLCLHQHIEGGEKKEGGREEKEGKREGRKKGGARRKNGRGRGWGGTNHVTSLLLTSPRAATKGGMPSYLLYCVALPCFLSPRREKGEESNECDPFTAHPHKHTHTHINIHTQKKVQTVPQLKKIVLLKN